MISQTASSGSIGRRRDLPQRAGQGRASHKGQVNSVQTLDIIKVKSEYVIVYNNACSLNCMSKRSFAKLMHSCSNEFTARISHPKISKMPMNFTEALELKSVWLCAWRACDWFSSLTTKTCSYRATRWAHERCSWHHEQLLQYLSANWYLTGLQLLSRQGR